MEKKHDCVSKVIAGIKRANEGVEWVRIDLSNIKNFREKDAIEKTGQKIEYGYKYKKKDGSVIEKTKKSFVTHQFCPFCGEKYS